MSQRTRTIEVTDEQATVIKGLFDPYVGFRDHSQGSTIMVYEVKDTRVSLYVIDPDGTYSIEVLHRDGFGGGWITFDSQGHEIEEHGAAPIEGGRKIEDYGF